MYFDHLSLLHFRNYETFDLPFYRGLNLFYGDNAQGKTNLLEAMFLFASGRSHRTARERELIQFGEKSAQVSAKFYAQKRDFRGDIRFFRDQKKEIRVNQIEIKKIADLMGFINIVFFGPENLNLIQDGPGERRKFLDLSISQLRPNYCNTLSLYQKVLMHRNSLVKNGRGRLSYGVLDVFDEKLAVLGADIMLHRILYLEKLTGIVQKIHRFLSHGEEELAVRYKPSFSVSDDPTKKGLHARLKKELEESFDTDLHLGYTTRGPHRDDMELQLGGRNAKYYGSQGQKRTAVIALKLSEMEFVFEDRNEYPVVLLDDIMSELDEKRQSYLLEFVKDKQVFLTDTDGSKSRFSQDCVSYQIQNGTVNFG